MANYTTLKKGSKGEDVARMQRMLIARGYYCGSGGVDGLFGSSTLSAVAAFQTDHNLKVDGIAGQKTLAALYAIDYAAIGACMQRLLKDIEKLPDFETLEVLFGGG